MLITIFYFFLCYAACSEWSYIIVTPSIRGIQRQASITGPGHIHRTHTFIRAMLSAGDRPFQSTSLIDLDRRKAGASSPSHRRHKDRVKDSILSIYKTHPYPVNTVPAVLPALPACLPVHPPACPSARLPVRLPANRPVCSPCHRLRPSAVHVNTVSML